MIVKLLFNLDEDVTPDLFAGKVAKACALGALRPGESVQAEGGAVVYTVQEVDEA